MSYPESVAQRTFRLVEGEWGEDPALAGDDGGAAPAYPLQLLVDSNRHVAEIITNNFLKITHYFCVRNEGVPVLYTVQ